MPENNQDVGQGIVFVASVAKVVTMADGGLRIVLDLPEDAIDAATWCMLAKRAGVAVRVHMIAQ